MTIVSPTNWSFKLFTEPTAIIPGVIPGLAQVCNPPCPSLPVAITTYTVAKKTLHNFHDEKLSYLLQKSLAEPLQHKMKLDTPPYDREINLLEILKSDQVLWEKRT